MSHLKNRKISLFLAFLVVGLGCASKKKTEDIVRHQESVNYVNRYAEINSAIEKEDYAHAHTLSDKYLRELPVNELTTKVQFYLARSLEGLSKWNEAIDGYRVVVLNGASTKRLQAEALYRLSFCYEAIGQDNKLVGSLLDVLKRKDAVDVEVSSAEVPARMAAAYARLGNRKLADKYFAQAEAGIKAIKLQRSQADLSKWLPKTLYFMGATSTENLKLDDIDATLEPLEKSQSYLVEAALLSDPKWSAKSVDEIKSIYSGIIKTIQSVPLTTGDDMEPIERAQQEKKWKLASTTLEVLRKLKISIFATKNPQPPEVEKIVEFIEEREGDLTKILDEAPTGSGLTPEAKSRQGIKRKGRVLDPDPVLEEMAKKRNL